jgi:hypothetical protein
MFFGHRAHGLNGRWPLLVGAHTATQSARTWLCIAVFVPACAHGSGVDETNASERGERVDDTRRRQLNHMKAFTRTWCGECGHGKM